MADFKFNCPHCGQSLEAPENMLGDTIDCPSCGGKIELPNPEPAPPPRPRPQRPRPQHTQQHTQQKQTVETNVKQGALIGGAVCFVLGVVMMCVSLWTVIVYAPLFLAAFVLSIVAMAQKRIAGGVILLVMTVLLPPILAIGIPAFKSARSIAQQTATGVRSSTTVDRRSGNDPTSPPPLPTVAPIARTPPKPESPAPRSPTPVDPVQVLRQGISGTKTSYDKFKGMSWVEPVQETDIKVSSHVSLAFRPYIGVSDKKAVVFRVYTHYIDRRSEYHDTDWIFYESVILLNANGDKFTLAIDYGDRDSDVEDWGLMEHADIPLKPEAVERLSALMKSPPVDVRFSGKSVVDAKLSDEQIQAAQSIIAGWRRLTATE